MARPSGTILRLALAYWAAVFAVAFALGVVRVLLVAPRIGATGAVLVEVPLVLATSWLVARALLRRHPLAPGPAAAMGALAFALLMASETLLAVAGFNQTPGQWLAAMATLPGALGLAGQVAFAAMPAAVAGLRR